MNLVTLGSALSLLVSLMVSGCEAKTPADKAVTGPVQGETPPAAKQSDSFPYERQLVADRLDVPWDMAIAPDGRIFVTERPGAIRVIEKGKLREEPVYRFNDTFYTKSEAGLLGITLDPNFASNRYMYVYHTYRSGNQIKNRVVRLVEKDNAARIDKVLLDDLPGENIHDGGRIRFGPDGMLYVTNGDANDRPMAQDVTRLGGKIMRIQPDGGVPKDNPFAGSPVYSLGHRNPQGLAWHPVTKELFSSEHGQSAHDEINRIEPGGNYGWPYIEGDRTEPAANDKSKLGPGKLIAPIVHSKEETWAPSGITFVSRGPWKGNLLVACLRGTRLLRIELGSDNRTVKQVDTLLKDELGRIRNVVEGPDGSIYVMTNNRDGRGQPKPDDDKLIRFAPKFN
ncbi:PQQ-dependent sugar dehydrogenase [Paenibacillus hamazuiensis]|uniref:PQQ-dependent sugar dehydrogenase n=1 Tax=Paenibacillus hamazuiensis TaxID=2936508 RepID=UPI0030844004